MAAIYQLLPQLAGIMDTFSKLGTQNVERLLNQLRQYGDATDGQVSWMRRKSGAIMVMGMLQSLTGVAAAFFPKSADSTLPPPIADGFIQTIALKLTENAFLRTTLHTASKGFQTISGAASPLFDSVITPLEATRSIHSQVRFQQAQEGLSSADRVVQKMNEIADKAIDKANRSR